MVNYFQNLKLKIFLAQKLAIEIFATYVCPIA